jgi:hypothetical protein
MSATADAAWATEIEGRLLPAQQAGRANLRGDLSGADWRFILPALDLRRVLFLGSPTPGVVSALADTVEQIIVASDDPPGLSAVRRTARERHLEQVMTVLVPRYDRLPLSTGSMDLVMGCKGTFSGLQRFRTVAPEVERILAPTGMLYFETTRPIDALHARMWSRRWEARGRGRARFFWLLQHKGETRAILPSEDRSTVSRYLFDRVLYGLSRKGRWLRSSARLLNRLRILPYVHPRRAVLLQRGASPAPTVLPFDHILRLGAESGVHLEGRRSGLFARGNYNSNKVGLFVFPPGEGTPEVIIKMTRAAAFNYRLETEFRSLRLLQEVMGRDEGAFPSPLFLDYHGGLAVVGQGAIDGVPFRTRTTNTADCPYAGAAIDWVTRLAAASADDASASAVEVVSVFTALSDQFDRVYRLPDEETRYLRNQIASLLEGPGAFPLVVQHGDAGTWNVLVTKQDRIAFLDWESSIEKGLPLWDLFYFLRSFGIWTARLQGERDRVESYSRLFLNGSPFSDLQRNAVAEYCARTGIHPHLIAPLFYTCWMHRALKEASWSTRPPEEGHYVNLLRLCIRQRDAEGLRWLKP